MEEKILADLPKKMVILTGPRQVGKTTLGRRMMENYSRGQCLNWDVLADRAVLQRQSWNPRSDILVLDEIHKMRKWKAWLKGVVDGKSLEQSLLVTGSARMETFRQGGDSLAGRYFAFRLHPFSVREWCEQTGVSSQDALEHLLRRGGFPEPCLSEDPVNADRWRMQYFNDLIREDVVEFSRLQEITTMRLFVELLRERVGSPLSLASIGRDLAVAPATVKHYLDILQALFIVFVVRPWHRNIARAILQSPKVYFYDNGLVKGDQGVVLENAVAGMLLKHIHFLQDSQGRSVDLHYIRTKDGLEIDFGVSEAGTLTQMIECKLSDDKPHRGLLRMGKLFPDAEKIQIAQNLRQEEWRSGVGVVDAAQWLRELAA